jgi:hypothetical protein
MKKKTLIGATIVRMRIMTKGEMADYGWDDPGLVLELDNGQHLFAAKDTELSGPACLVVEDFPHGPDPVEIERRK